MAWSLLRFVGADLSLLALQKLHPNLAAEWIAWLRATEPTQAIPWSLPKGFTQQGVAEFLRDCQLHPPRPMAGKTRRRNATVNRCWRDGGSQLLKWLGQPAKLTRQELPKRGCPTPFVPTIDDLVGDWQGILTARTGAATPSQRRRVVLTQAFLLLTGLRKGEALLVEQDGLAGHFLFVPAAITKPRIPKLICVNAQALGIAAALRGQLTFGFAHGKRHRLLGWPYTPGHFEKLVAACGAAPWKHRQQVLRQRCSTWVRARDPDAEQVQLGHGGGDVITRCYLDKLRELPALMNQFSLPPLDVPGWAWPAAIAASPSLRPGSTSSTRRPWTPPAGRPERSNGTMSAVANQSGWRRRPRRGKHPILGARLTWTRKDGGAGGPLPGRIEVFYRHRGHRRHGQLVSPAGQFFQAADRPRGGRSPPAEGGGKHDAEDRP